MTPFPTPDADFERRLGHRLLEVLIRATLLLAMALLCYRVLAPFLPLAIWAVIFAVTLYPLHLRIAAYLGGRRGLAATLLVVLGIAVLVVPIAILMSSLGNSRPDPDRGPAAEHLADPAPARGGCGLARHWREAPRRLEPGARRSARPRA